MLEIGLYLTYNCNQTCQFCFKKSVSDSHISDENLSIFCEWCKRAGVDRVKIAGGEPTTHPKFAQHIEKIKSILGSRAAPHIITNLKCGTRELVAMSDCDILINAATDHSLTDDFRRNLAAVVSYPGTRVTLAYTLYNLYQYDSHLLPHCLDFGITKVRLDFSRASLLRGNEHVTLDTIDKFKPKMLSIGRRLAERGIFIFFDCPLPRDLFSAEELHSMNVSKIRHTQPGSPACEMIYINPDMTISSCPFRVIENRRLFEFPDAERLFSTTMIALMRKTEKGKKGEFLCPAERFI